jgi:hypothetical protein
VSYGLEDGEKILSFPFFPVSAGHASDNPEYAYQILKPRELARIAYLALLHAESELGEETNTFDEDTWAEQLRGLRLSLLGMFSDTNNKASLDKAIYLIWK